MKLLVCMRDCIANADFENFVEELTNLRVQRSNLTEQIMALRHVHPFIEENLNDLTAMSADLSRVIARIAVLERNPNGNQDLAGQIRALFLCHLMGAPLLEVDTLGTADIARNLHESYGWSGSACMNGEIPMELRNEIIQQLGNVPHRIYHMVLGVPMFGDDD